MKNNNHMVERLKYSVHYPLSINYRVALCNVVKYILYSDHDATQKEKNVGRK